MLMFPFPSNGKVQGKNTGSDKGSTETNCFNSLQTGRYRESLLMPVLFTEQHPCFNSLQTGRYRESRNEMHSHEETFRFQFPSNGKVHGKAFQRNAADTCPKLVSIPFKREGTSKVIICVACYARIRARVVFNSLQTGRYIERSYCCKNDDCLSKVSIPFQTGRYIERKYTWTSKICSTKEFSIPFKREGTGKANVELPPRTQVSYSFHSLQTGRYRESLPSLMVSVGRL